MRRRGGSFSAIRGLILGSAVLLCTVAATAQHQNDGGSVGGGMNGSISGSNRPTGFVEEDSLKGFHQTMALQASGEQIGEFQVLIKNVEVAQAELKSFAQQLQNSQGAPESSRREALNRALEAARTTARKFQEDLAPAQKAALKDLLKRLAKSDADLDLDQKRLDQAFDAKAAAPELASHAVALDKALADFYGLHLALGRELSITLVSGQDLAFTLPTVRTPARIENLSIPVTVSGVLSQTAAQADRRTFHLALTTDLTDLQQNIEDLLRAQLDSFDSCGQRVSIRQAALTPASPATLLTVRLHFERWMCPRSSGLQIASELAEGDGTVEIKLTAAIQNPEKETQKLVVTPALGHVNATGMLGELLRSGQLGEDLKNAAAQALRSAAHAGTDFSTVLPSAVRNSASLQTAKFREVGAGGVAVVLEGQVEISNEQADQLARQLNQTLSAERAPAQ